VGVCFLVFLSRFMTTRHRSQGRYLKTYYTSLQELKKAHRKIFSNAPSSVCIQRNKANGAYVMLEAIYREPINFPDTKKNLSKIMAQLLTFFPTHKDPWELSKKYIA
jgi:hypothetical protein